MFKLFLSAFFNAPGHNRTQARYSILDGLARRWGFRVYNGYLDWCVNDAEYLKQFREFDPAQWRLHERRFVMSSIAAATVGLPGDTAECGVFEGATSFQICRTRAHKKDVTHHCFDSFEGLSEPTTKDAVTDERAYVWKKSDLTSPLEKTKKNLERFASMVQYHPGWIPDRFPDVEDRQFSLVHVDVDLFEPTASSLDFFYPRLVPGGMIVCDDYGSTWCPGAKKACDEFCATIPQQTVIHLTTGQGIIIKQASHG